MTARLSRVLVSVLVLMLGVSGLGLAQAPSTPKVGKIYGQGLYSSDVGVVDLGIVTGDVSGNTQFGSTYLEGWGDDYFNLGFKAYALTGCTNITAGTLVDITDYTSVGGVFTTTSAGAAWANDDRVLIVFGNVAAGLGFETVGAGVISACTNSGGTPTTTQSSITVPAFAGLNTVMFSAGGAMSASNWYLKIVSLNATSSDNDELMLDQPWRIITTLSAAGVIVVKPAFTDAAGAETLDAGDIVEIVRFEDINLNTQVKYMGMAASGGSGTAVFTDLIQRLNAIPIGARLYCVNDASAATNDDLMATVTGFTASTGTVTFSPVFTPAVLDRFVIEYNTPTAPQTTIQTTIAAAALDAHAAAGELITAAAVGGSVYVQSLTLQIITAAESSVITSYLLKSSETGANDLAMALRFGDGRLLEMSDCTLGECYTFPVNHLLPVAGTLSLVPSTDSAGAGYVISVTYTAPFGASIAGL